MRSLLTPTACSALPRRGRAPSIGPRRSEKTCHPPCVTLTSRWCTLESEGQSAAGLTDKHAEPMAMPVQRIAVVTGASSGVGRAIALALAREGTRLCAVGRNPERLAQTVAAARSFGRAEGFQLDLANDSECPVSCRVP